MVFWHSALTFPRFETGFEFFFSLTPVQLKINHLIFKGTPLGFTWLLGYPQGATLGLLTLTAQAQLRCLKMDISVFVSQPGETRQKAPHLHMRDLCQNWLGAESSCCSPPVPLHEAAAALASSSGAYRITQNLFCSFNALKPLLRSRPPKDRDGPCHKEHADDVPEGIKHIKRNRWVKQVGRMWPEKKSFIFQ